MKFVSQFGEHQISYKKGGWETSPHGNRVIKQGEMIKFHEGFYHTDDPDKIKFLLESEDCKNKVIVAMDFPIIAPEKPKEPTLEEVKEQLRALELKAKAMQEDRESELEEPEIISESEPEGLDTFLPQDQKKVRTWHCKRCHINHPVGIKCPNKPIPVAV